jgi:hypothetical protein
MAAVDVTSVVSLPLGRAALCLDCERVFELGPETAPCCGAREWYPLERFFVASGERRLVRVGDVIHEAGNGLTPARVRAERLIEALEEYLALGLARGPAYLKLCLVHARRIVEAIDETMRRLRALSGERDEPGKDATR